MDAWLRIWALTRKELLAVLKDKAARVSLLLPPVLQALIFGYAVTYDLDHVPYAVLDRDHSSLSRELVAKIEGSGVFERVGDPRSDAQAGRLLDVGQALLVLRIDHGFERELLAGRAADVQVIADGRNSNTANIAVGYVNAIVETFNTEWRVKHDQKELSLTVVTRAWYNPNLETRWNIMPGMIGMLSLLQTLVLTAMSVAREREQGTFDQLLVTPYRPFEIMVGKALPSIFIGIAQASLILMVATLWFRIPLVGSLVALYAGLILFTTACVGIGLSISALSASMQQAMLYTFMLTMPFMLLSGLATPIKNMPEAMQWFTAANPLRYGIDIVQRIYLEGVGLGTLIGDIAALAVIAALTLPLAAWLFRHRLA